MECGGYDRPGNVCEAILNAARKMGTYESVPIVENGGWVPVKWEWFSSSKGSPALRMKALRCMMALASAAGLALAAVGGATAKTYDAGTEAGAEFVQAQVVESPQPVIPPALHENCFKSCCLARFMIAADGKSKVKLLSSSGSDEIDDITLETLRKWKFKPAMLDGKPVASTRRIKVEFEVD